MGMGQTILTTAFLVLISIAIINIVKMVSDKDAGYYEKLAIEQSGELSHALLDEIATKKFDSTVDTSAFGYALTTSFDIAMGAGAVAYNYVMPGGTPDSYTPFRSIRGDNGNYYDDIDDYNGYVRITSSGSLTGFRLWVSVYYVNVTTVGSNVNISASGLRTYFKKVDVRVSNTIYMADTLTYSRVIQY